jgi:hypothetical protein
VGSDLARALVQAARLIAKDIASRDRFNPSLLAFTLARTLRGVVGNVRILTRDLLTLLALPIEEACAILQRAPWIRAVSEPVTPDTLLLKVVAAWDQIRKPGGDALIWAVHEACTRPLVLGAPFSAPLLTALISSAHFLQRHQGDNPIELPRKRLGALLGCDPSTVSDLVKIAIKFHLLAVVSDDYSYKDGKAKEYRFSFVAAALFTIPGTELP